MVFLLLNNDYKGCGGLSLLSSWRGPVVLSWKIPSPPAPAEGLVLPQETQVFIPEGGPLPLPWRSCGKAAKWCVPSQVGCITKGQVNTQYR